MTDAIEKVARAWDAAEDEWLLWEEDARCGLREEPSMPLLEFCVRAAIAAVLDDMIEPSEGMIDEYQMFRPMVGSPERLADPRAVKIYEEGVYRAGIRDWQAMLAQYTKEALG